ncbi:MAG TPA: hypothetical protein QGF05_02095 [Dehalococcoidia bacterium]|nr:hypothetical protein [Dehalococcoidia bacterium]
MSSNPRPVRLIDLPFLALSSQRIHPNQAVTLRSLASRDSQRLPTWDLIRASTRLTRGRKIWISRDGSTLLGVAGVRRRSASIAWEIDHLVPMTANEAFLLDLLDRVVATAGANGAHRLFLRVAQDSEILAAALRHGFTVAVQETLFEAGPTNRAIVSNPAPSAPGATIPRRRRRGDDHALFQLHSQTVNQEVRWLTALSPAEWRAAQEPLGPKGSEWVVPTADNTGAQSLVRLSRGTAGVSAGILSATATTASGSAPDASTEALNLALRQTKKAQRFRLLVPDDALQTARAAETAGLAEAAHYALLVRPIAQRAHRMQTAERAVEGSARPVIQ